MYALQKIMPPVILRPSVTVTGLGALDPLTNRQQADLLTCSLIAAGAAQVVFPEIEQVT